MNDTSKIRYYKEAGEYFIFAKPKYSVGDYVGIDPYNTGKLHGEITSITITSNVTDEVASLDITYTVKIDNMINDHTMSEDSIISLKEEVSQ